MKARFSCYARCALVSMLTGQAGLLPAGACRTGEVMTMRSVLCAVATATALAAVPAGAAVAKADQPGHPAASAARGAGAVAVAHAGQRISTTGLHMVSGVVRDQTGRGLSGVCILADGAGGVVRTARTSANGSYELSLPRAGTYSVQYRDCSAGRASVAATARHQVQVGASPITALSATILTRSGKETGEQVPAVAGIIAPKRQRIMLAPAGEVIEDGRARQQAAGSAKPAVITGRVTAPSGRPLAGVCMWIVGTYFAAGTSTSKRGVYRFEIAGGGIAGHKYPVEFDSSCGNSDPFVPIAPGRWAPEWYKDKFAGSEATTVPLRTGKTTRGINAVMQRGGEVSGTIDGSDHRPIKDGCAVLTNSAGAEFGQAVTNAKGQYTITGLDQGRYRLVGLGACGTTGDYAPRWYPHAASIKKAQVVDVRRGHRTSNVSVTLQKLGTVTGFVRFGGRTGRPLHGICVNVFSPTNPEAGGFAVSRKNGSYVVDGLATGRYDVQAAAGCGNNGNYAPAQYPHAVQVADGRTTSGISLSMRAGGTLTGTITDAATAKPLSGICVSDASGDFAVSGKNGSYKIDQLPAERTNVEFNGGCGNAGSYAPQYYDDQVAQEAARRVTVTAGHVTRRINAAMRPGATIAGLVTNPAGQPVARVCVAIEPPAYLSEPGPIGGDTVTNATGSYEESNLAPGDYAVAFFSGCLGPSNTARAQWFKGQPGQATAGLVDAAAGAEVSGVDAAVSRGGAISGTVTSTAGSPIDFDCVTAFSRRTGQPSGFQSNSGSGLYTISSLAPGRYTVVASDCYLGSSLSPSAYRSAVTVRAGATTKNIALTLPPGGTVAGRIVQASNGRPVRDACVEATSVSSAAADLGFDGAALTGRVGTYKITGLRAGSYRIEIYPSCADINLRSITLPHTVRVTPGTVRAGVNASLRAGGSIAGLIAGPAGAAEAGACAEAFELPGGLAAVGTAGAHGSYVLTGLTPGSYKVKFGDQTCSDNAPGLGTQWYSGAAGSGSATVVTVTAGQTASAIDGSLPADGTISGSVTGTSASPLTGICISAVPVVKTGLPVFTVSANGAYTLADIQPGRYRVEFQAGCGGVSVKTQWWQDAVSSTTAKIVNVRPGDTVSDIDAVMTST
jgi:Carboxypeptidase regulatory-like domain